MGFTGNKFTWSNNRWGKHSIKERLDRGISSMEWRLKFPRASIFHLGAINSDHCPILLDTIDLSDLRLHGLEIRGPLRWFKRLGFQIREVQNVPSSIVNNKTLGMNSKGRMGRCLD